MTVKILLPYSVLPKLDCKIHKGENVTPLCLHLNAKQHILWVACTQYKPVGLLEKIHLCSNCSIYSHSISI